MTTCSRFLRLALAAVLAGAPFPLVAQPVCLAVELDGAAGPAVFADGFESGDTVRWSESGAPAFSTTATDDLAATVEIDGAATGEHLLELRWYLPGGGLYQSVAVPFAAGVAPAAAGRRIDGYPFPVEVRAATERSRAGFGGVFAVSDRLPVAGSSIVEAALWGEWRLEAFLDGGTEPCAAAVLFRMEP
jgi:hypothetical protein